MTTKRKGTITKWSTLQKWVTKNLIKASNVTEKWIQKAIKHKGALHKALHVKAGMKIPAGKLTKAAHSKNPTLRKRATLAETLKKMPKK